MSHFKIGQSQAKDFTKEYLECRRPSGSGTNHIVKQGIFFKGRSEELRKTGRIVERRSPRIFGPSEQSHLVFHGPLSNG
jgi:hypothetical protein